MKNGGHFTIIMLSSMGGGNFNSFVVKVTVTMLKSLPGQIIEKITRKNIFHDWKKCYLKFKWDSLRMTFSVPRCNRCCPHLFSVKYSTNRLFVMEAEIQSFCYTLDYKRLMDIKSMITHFCQRNCDYILLTSSLDFTLLPQSWPHGFYIKDNEVENV